MHPFMVASLLIAALLVSPSLLSAAPVPQDLSRAEAIPSQDKLKLAFPGQKGPVDYAKYGRFEQLDTPRYKYVIEDRPGLIKAA